MRSLVTSATHSRPGGLGSVSAMLFPSNVKDFPWDVHGYTWQSDPESANGGNVPTYAYACTACEHSFEIVQSFTDDSLTRCPECEGRLRKLFNAVGVVFKGSGFYSNDSRTDSRGGKASGPSTRSGSGAGSSTDSSSDSGGTGSDSSASASTSSSDSSSSAGATKAKKPASRSEGSAA